MELMRHYWENGSLLSSHLWHCRWGHLNAKVVADIVGGVFKSSNKSVSKCESCMVGKSYTLPHYSRNKVYDIFH